MASFSAGSRPERSCVAGFPSRVAVRGDTATVRPTGSDSLHSEDRKTQTRRGQGPEGASTIADHHQHSSWSVKTFNNYQRPVGPPLTPGCSETTVTTLQSGREEFAMPYAVGVREAKAKFSSLLARVRSGDAVTITDRGRPVAQLVPLPASARSLEERLHTMEEQGFIAAIPPASGPLPPLVSVPEQGLAQRMLQEDRGAR